jgi:hypothetical protein
MEHDGSFKQMARIEKNPPLRNRLQKTDGKTTICLMDLMGKST